MGQMAIGGRGDGSNGYCAVLKEGGGEETGQMGYCREDGSNGLLC